MSWLEKNTVNAWAESTYPDSREGKVEHKITISYGLIQQLYQHSKMYHEFMVKYQDSDYFSHIFQNHNPKSKLPKFDSPENSINNMLLGGLTWVYFHELGHLIQEHGYIRKKFSSIHSSSSCIEESYSNFNISLQGKDSSIFHTTEFAADFEAINFCVTELIRHFFTDDEIKRDVISEDSRHEFLSTLYLFVCGLTCTMYLFYGNKKNNLTSSPEGSHPQPIRRLDACIPHLIEKLDLIFKCIPSMKLNRPEIVYLCIGASHSYGIFWQSSNNNHEIELPEGIQQDPHYMSYWRNIIKTWDEIKNEVESVRWSGSTFGLLQFSDEFRKKFFD
jgi:hypothetical protein